MKIFDIKEEFAGLNRLIEEESETINPETGEFINNDDLINDLLLELENKKGDLLDFLVDKRLEAQHGIEAFRDKMSQLQDKKRALEMKIQRLMGTIDFVLEGEKFKSSEHTFYYQKTVSVEILDQDLIPERFINFVPTVNKTELKKELIDSGEEIEGATLKETIGLRIR